VRLCCWIVAGCCGIAAWIFIELVGFVVIFFHGLLFSW
jgi:hypothetical protein